MFTDLHIVHAYCVYVRCVCCTSSVFPLKTRMYGDKSTTKVSAYVHLWIDSESDDGCNLIKV